MSEPFHLRVGMVLQRNGDNCEDAVYSFNAILGAHVRVEDIDDMGIVFIVLDGIGEGWQMRRGWHRFTAEWFIPD